MSPLVSQIMARAFATLGEQEVPGTKSNSTILGWIRRWFPRHEDDSTLAWCGVWVATVMSDCGLPVPPMPFRARSWRLWGTRREGEPQLGDVVVLTRSGGHHVAICLRATPDVVWVIGGNQQNAVTVAKYDRKRVVAVRSPE
jgi:uncharacterized protein (TIGR02594 family)